MSTKKRTTDRIHASSAKAKDRAVPSEAVKAWNVALEKMLANREGFVPKDEKLEEALTKEMEGIMARLTPYELTRVQRPPPPRLRGTLSLIAHNSRGELIGYEDVDGGD